MRGNSGAQITYQVFVRTGGVLPADSKGIEPAGDQVSGSSNWSKKSDW